MDHRVAFGTISLGMVIACCLSAPVVAGDPYTRTELAGTTLGEYPFFHHVRNFNADESVFAAIDPGRFPEIADSRASVYVVEAKTPAAWASDPALVDVRPGGPSGFGFGGSTIQANIVPLAGPGELSSDAGFGLGHAYDVVLDLNANGALDAGDYLDDGGADTAGLYVVHDTAQPGPFAVTTVDYSGGTFLDQHTYYPTNIAAIGPVPLIVISHGWTYQLTFYDYLQEHLASYGYVVMAHSNATGNGRATGTQSASTTTLTNTDYFLGNLDTIAGGALDGHVDGGRIVWVGHSTGAEAVVMAYTRLRNGGFAAANFDADDIALLSPIAPVAWWTIADVDPMDANLHMFLGGADTDTSGAPLVSYTQPGSIFERSTGTRQLIYIQGVGHGNFLDVNAASPLASGPDLIGWTGAHPVIKGYFLPLVELYTRSNPAGLDYFTRLYDDFRPIGIAPEVVVAIEFRDARARPKFVVDDFQSSGEFDVSSSGGNISFSVSNPREILMQDNDSSFAWTGTQASNGMTRARFIGDTPRCVVFDWSPAVPGYYEQEIVPAERDLRDDAYLSFRACQGTRHPETVALDAPLTFTVTLRDECGGTSSIHTGAYGGITSPYKRTGLGAGAGWQSEFSTVRLRLADFVNNGSGLDLGHVEAIRFEFGPGLGSERGRLGLDDIEILPSDSPIPGLPSPCCPTDTNDDGVTNIDDIVNVVLDFGTKGTTHNGDIDGSGFVDIDDIVKVVLAFGRC